MASDSSLVPPPDGAISERDFADYMGVVRDALLIHYEREQVRNGLWKEYAAVDQVNSIKVKIDRVFRSLEILKHSPDKDLEKRINKNIREELLDIINYSNFAIRQL